MRPGWIDAWWRAFGRGKLTFLSVHRGNDLVALAPLARRFGALSATANWHSPAFVPIVADREASVELCRALLCRPHTAMLSLRPVPSQGALVTDLREVAAAAEQRVLEHVQLRSPYIELGGTIEEFRARKCPDRRVLSEIRRRRRHLSAEGEVSFEVHDGSKRLDEILEECFEVEAAGWQGANGTAMSFSASDEGFLHRDWALGGRTRPAQSSVPSGWREGDRSQVLPPIQWRVGRRQGRVPDRVPQDGPREDDHHGGDRVGL